MPLSRIVKAVAVYLTLSFLQKSCHVLAVGNYNHIWRQCRRFSQWKLNWLWWDFEMESWKDSCCLRREASAVLDDQDWERMGGQKTLDMWKNCLSKLTLRISKNFIPNLIAFFVLLGIAVGPLSCTSFPLTSPKREFTPAIVSLFTSREADIVHQSEIANQSDFLKYQRHRVCVYMLIIINVNLYWVYFKCKTLWTDLHTGTAELLWKLGGWLVLTPSI